MAYPDGSLFSRFKQRHFLLRQVATTSVALLIAVIASNHSVYANEVNHSADEHMHKPLAIDTHLNLNQVLQAALANANENILSQPYQAQAIASKAYAGRWVNGSPSLDLSYYQDKNFDNIGLEELEAGITFSLWRVGEKRNTKQLASALNDENESWQAYLEWLVTGRVRNALLMLKESAVNLEFEEEALHHAQRIVDTTTTLFNAGSVSKQALLQAENLNIDQQQRVLNAQAEVVDSEREFSILTHLETKPSFVFSETRSATNEINLHHPYLAYQNAKFAVASKQAKQSRYLAKGSPEMTIGIRQDKSDQFSESISSLGVSLSLPFGGGNYVNHQTNVAVLNASREQVTLKDTQLMLTRELHEAEHELFVLEASIKLGEQQAAINEERREMALLAFESGEITLTEVILTLQETLAADKTFAGMKLRKTRLISEFNQIIGEPLL